MNVSNPKRTPAELGTLRKYTDDLECDENFNYYIIVGMILYIQGHSRPDI